MSGYYFTPEGLQQVALFESSNNPTAQNPSSTASGLYGFTNSTWAQYVEMYSPGLSAIYPTAASAPADIQTAVAQITPSSNWTCPGCDASITTAVQADPSLLSSTPITAAIVSSPDDYSGGTTGTGSFLDSLSSLNPFAASTIANDPNNPGGTGTGAQAPVGGASSLNPFSSNAIANDPNNPGGTGTGAQSPAGQLASWLSGASSWWQTAVADVENILERGGFAFLAIVLIAVGLWALLKNKGSVGATVVNTGKTAVKTAGKIVGTAAVAA
jgi:hypothetical protein